MENQVINLFNSTMESLNKTESTNSYKKLNDTSIDELPARLSKFFMCCLKENGKVFNASSLSTFYRVLIRYPSFVTQTLLTFLLMSTLKRLVKL